MSATRPVPTFVRRADDTAEGYLGMARQSIARACDTGDDTHMWSAVMQVASALALHLTETPAPNPALSPGRLIRDARKRADLTQAELGARLDPPRSHASISDIERDVTALDFATLDRLATALGVPLLIDITLGNTTARVAAPEEAR